MQIHRDSFPRASLSDSFAANRGGKKNIYMYIKRKDGGKSSWRPIEGLWMSVVKGRNSRGIRNFLKDGLNVPSLQARQGLIQLGWLPLVSRMAL